MLDLEDLDTFFAAEGCLVPGCRELLQVPLEPRHLTEYGALLVFIELRADGQAMEHVVLRLGRELLVRRVNGGRKLLILYHIVCLEGFAALSDLACPIGVSFTRNDLNDLDHLDDVAHL